ncbi:hypothetical protein M011DRAFT_372004, partial [Sporormia fimetaria CBS 119925]
SSPSKRACDNCHKRKVKCVGEQPCRSCRQAGIACTYNTLPQKKGPKGNRAKVLSEIRESQKPIHADEWEGKIGSRPAITAGLLSVTLVQTCLEYYYSDRFALHSLQPIIHHEQFTVLRNTIGQSGEAYCLLAAMCANIILYADAATAPLFRTSLPQLSRLTGSELGIVLLKESMHVRQNVDYREQPSHHSVLTSWCYYVCFIRIRRSRTAWTYLQEAITLARLLEMHKEVTYTPGPGTAEKRALYWLLFTSERAEAIRSHQSVFLYPTIRTPIVDQSYLGPGVAAGLDYLVHLYRRLDDRFFRAWNQVERREPDVNYIQQGLATPLPHDNAFTEAQSIELRITQCWLRLSLWQLCVTQGWLNRVLHEGGPISLDSPLEVCRESLHWLEHCSFGAKDIHGTPFMEKIYLIGSCLLDFARINQCDLKEISDLIRRFANELSSSQSGQHYAQPLWTQFQSFSETHFVPSFPGPGAPRAANPPTLMTVPSNAPPPESRISPPIHGSHPVPLYVPPLASQTGEHFVPVPPPHAFRSSPSTALHDLSLGDTVSPHGATYPTAQVPGGGGGPETTPMPY